MSYTKNTWVDQDVERPKTYEVTKNQDGSITLTDSFGLVKELGTPVNAVNMNHIEDGIDGCAIRKHNLTETFNLGEWVLGGTGDVEGIYKSLIPNNVGNAISDTTAWQKVEMGGGYEVGDVIWRLTPTQDSGKHLFDGALINGSGSYAAFVTYIAGLVTDYPDLFVTEADWQSSVTTYGSCGKFVYNATDNTVRLPKVSDILQGTTDITALGDLIEAGLPNITAKFALGSGSTASGAVYISGYTGGEGGGSGGTDDQGWFDASRSSSIYGNSTTVQPQTIKAFVYIVIANSTKTSIQVDIDKITTDLNGKADTDLSNVPNSKGILTESYVNGTSWYRVWSDGWCEQGGTADAGTANFSITFLKEFNSTNYVSLVTPRYMSVSNIFNFSTTNIATTGMTINTADGAGSASRPVSWYVCGYIR